MITWYQVRQYERSQEIQRNINGKATGNIYSPDEQPVREEDQDLEDIWVKLCKILKD